VQLKLWQSLAIRISKAYIADYNELDDEDHMHLSRILSSEKLAASKQPAQVSLPEHTIVMPPTISHLQPLNPLLSVPNYAMPSAPVFNIQKLYSNPWTFLFYPLSMVSASPSKPQYP